MRYVTNFERDAKEEGWLEGIEKGKEIGVLEGAAQTRFEIAQRLVASGINKEQVVEITGVAIDLL